MLGPALLEGGGRGLQPSSSASLAPASRPVLDHPGQRLAVLAHQVVEQLAPPTDRLDLFGVLLHGVDLHPQLAADVGDLRLGGTDLGGELGERGLAVEGCTASPRASSAGPSRAS
ncbi:MAG: hypothetical protein U0W40_20240 [Acidimicrobiia bacterium]